MKRDRELLTQLLLKLEEWPSQPGDMFLFSGHEPELAIEGYSVDQIEYHLGILRTEGYIDSPGSQPMLGVTFRSLSPAGHDLVDRYREAVHLQAAGPPAEETAMPTVSARVGQTFQQKRRRIQQLQECIKDLGAFDIAAVRNRVPPEAMALENSIDEALSAAFGHGTVEYGRYKSAARLDHGPSITPSVLMAAKALRGMSIDVSAQQAQEAQQYLSDGRKQSVVLLQQAIRALEREIADQAFESDGQDEKPATEPQSPASKGGRYPAEFWDDLWVEMCRQLYEGDLKPKKQADIEKAMMNWLAGRGETPGVTTIRERARKLWQAVKDGN